jgi:hypothetical protein
VRRDRGLQRRDRRARTNATVESSLVEQNHTAGVAVASSDVTVEGL